MASASINYTGETDSGSSESKIMNTLPSDFMKGIKIDSPGYEIKIFESFDDMDLKDTILRGLYSHGFDKPSRIQQVGIVPMKSGRDLVAQAQSGTGKTGTFVTGTLNNIDITIPRVQAIILLPTRELAEQVYEVMMSIGSYMGVKVTLTIGGSSPDEQKREILRGSHILIGTPGRTYDLITNKVGSHYFDSLKMFVMDEADEMLSDDFQEQVREIFRVIPSTAQVCLFSATLEPHVIKITERFLRDPIKILVEAEALTLDGIKQYYVSMREQHKFAVLMDLYESMSIAQCIIYCNSRERVEEVADKLTKANFTVGMIHGKKEWQDRRRIMKDFREGRLRVLLATDLLARGIDVQQVAIVINYDIPRDISNYLHRIGRSGRYGRKGIGINFVTRETEELMTTIADHYKTYIEEMPINFTKHIE